MAQLHPGHTFVDGEEVTHVSLAEAIDNATLEDVTMTSLSQLRAIARSTSAPSSPSAGDLWSDLATTKLRAYLDGKWLSLGPDVIETTAPIHAAGTAVANGEAATWDPSNDEVLTQNPAASNVPLAIATEDVSVGTTGRFACFGKIDAKVHASGATILPSHYVMCSATHAGCFAATNAPDAAERFIGVALATISPGTRGSIFYWGRPVPLA